MAPLRIANAPCSWGALEFEWAGPAPAFARVLDEMALTGYACTELGDWGFLPTDPVRLHDELAQRHLALVGAFVRVRLSDEGAHADGVETALRVAALLAAVSGPESLIVLCDDTAADPQRTRAAGRVRPEHGLDERGWTMLTIGAERIGRCVREATGLQTVFHHHCATFVETEAEIDQLLTRTDPSLIGLCLDTGHSAFGGGDPLATLRRWRNRIRHVHLKDCDPVIRRRTTEEGWDYQQAVRHGVFCELGRGIVDFRGIVAELQGWGYDGWLVVEQDVLPSMGTPAESAARNRAYLRALGF
jgi:inosose dehydratase